MCKSLLLESALKRMINTKYITTFNECDVVLCDEKIQINKPYLLISNDKKANIFKPFTYSSLMLALQKFKKNSEVPKELEKKNRATLKGFYKKIG